MLNFLILGCFLAFAHGGVLPKKPHQLAMDWNISGKIVGGQNAKIEDAPYQVGLLEGTIFKGCGGSIMTESVIITAGHCVNESSASSLKIRAGSNLSNSGGQVIDVAKILVHPQYNSSVMWHDYDVALLFLQTPIKLDGIKTAPIPLPELNQEIPTGADAFATGWGATEEEGSPTIILQKVTIPIVSQEDCIKAFGSELTDRMICAGFLETGGQDACEGDSGGPLVVDGTLVGITSWGKGCARPDYPGIWTRVPALVDWITQNA